MTVYGNGSSPEYLCGMLGIDRPVLLAPMASIAGGDLAGAVSNAGGLGVLGGGYGNVDWIDEQWARSGPAPIGIGLISWNLASGVLEHVVRKRPAAVWLSFGTSADMIFTVHAAGIPVICQVGSVEEAVTAVGQGASVIVAQGSESGGHGPDGVRLVDLVPAISDALPAVPLVAAGGLNDRFDYERMGSLGAAGVALGTAFYATEEALDVPEAKAHLIQASGDSTIRSRVYDIVRGPEWPVGYTGRSLESALTQRWCGAEDELRADLGRVRSDYQRAVHDRDMTVRVVWAGLGVGEISEISSAATVTQRFPLTR